MAMTDFEKRFEKSFEAMEGKSDAKRLSDTISLEAVVLEVKAKEARAKGARVVKGARAGEVFFRNTV